MATNREPKNSSSADAKNEFDAERDDIMPQESAAPAESQDDLVTESPGVEDLSQSLTSSISSNSSAPKQPIKIVDHRDENAEDEPTTVHSKPLSSVIDSAPTDTVELSGAAAAMKLERKRPLWMAWQLWGIVIVILSGGIGYAATSMLLKLPETQSCTKVF